MTCIVNLILLKILIISIICLALLRGEFVKLSTVINELAEFHKQNPISALEFDDLQLEVIRFDNSNISAFDFDFNANSLLTNLKNNPVVLFTYPFDIITPSKRLIEFFMQCQIPASFEKLEWGILLTTKTIEELPDSEIKINGSKRPDTNSNTALAPYAQLTYQLTFSTSNNFDNHVLVRAQIYCNIKNKETQELSTIYSDVLHVQL